jgi:AcrR family transcriptional regulator
VASRAQEVDGRVLRAKEMREERREQILSAARRVFAKKGYAGGSISDVIKEAKIARGTFYLHFESKKEVFGEVLDALLEQLEANIVRVDVSAEASPYHQLLTNVERVLAVVEENADTARILLRPEGGQDAELRSRIDQFYDHAIAMIQSSLSDGIEMGMVKPLDKSAVETYAACVLGSIKEAVDRSLSRKSKKRADLRAIAQRLLDYNMYGILVR